MTLPRDVCIAEAIVDEEAATGRKVAHVAVEHRNGRRRVLEEKPETLGLLAERCVNRVDPDQLIVRCADCTFPVLTMPGVLIARVGDAVLGS